MNTAAAGLCKANVSRPFRKLGVGSSIEAKFEKHLVETGSKRATVMAYMGWVRRFREYIGDQRLDRLTDDAVKSFFQQLPGGKSNKRDAASIISQFLKFAAPRDLVVVTGNRGSETRVPAKDDSFAAVRQEWSIDKLKQQKEAGDDLIAKLGRKLIDHFLYFQGRIKGEPENLDDVYRFADECKELIQTNLVTFMGLSAQGRNVHSKIDERVQK